MDEIPVLSAQRISKRFGEHEVLREINIDIYEQEVIALVGHSGCGKTTLLRILCAFETSDTGSVLLDGLKHIKPCKDALMLFQSYDQLQPWRTILGNIIFALTASGIIKNKQDARELAIKRIADVGLTGFEDYYPHKLSGGMKQRAAVARALAIAPRVLLMDEPFSALDNITRNTLQVLTKRILDKYGITAILVTHSVEEAVIMADRIIVMDKDPGQIKQVFNNPGFDDDSLTQRTVFISEIMKSLGEESIREDLQ